MKNRRRIEVAVQTPATIEEGVAEANRSATPTVVDQSADEEEIKPNKATGSTDGGNQVATVWRQRSQPTVRLWVL